MTMPYFLFITIMTMIQTSELYNFSITSSNTDWVIVNDDVMGGKSFGEFHINQNGHGEFKGYVSLENNGGFSMLRHALNSTGIKRYSSIVLKVKGDGKKYQFRIKDKQSNYYTYIAYFQSPTSWETIKIPLSDFYPNFRGRKLNKPNYNSDNIEEIAFLIGNKKAEDFKLEIDYIDLE